MTGRRFISGPVIRLPVTSGLGMRVRVISGPAIRTLAIIAVAALAPACTSRDQQAATAAAMAADALQQGQVEVARKQINVALAARDDVADYWMLSARIALAEQNYGGAFEAYESVIMFDRSNLEALTRVCQIALSADQAPRADRYADQLLALHPGDPAATTVKAAIALKQGDRQTSTRLLDQVLAAEPNDGLALIVKSNLLAAAEDYAGAARAAEASLAAPGDPGGRLNVLKDAYAKSKDVEGYRRTIARVARAYPQMASAQLDYARSLYDAGDAGGGLALARRVLTLRPDDVGAANAILDLWVANGTAAMPVDAIIANANGGSLEARATYAQYATAIGRPDLALTILGDDAAQAPTSAATADAKAALALALALRGDTVASKTQVDAVLANDDDHPRALVARATLREKAGDRAGAIEDLRHALAGDGDDASARLKLAGLQLAGGDAVLAAATLQDGLGEEGADPRLATRLAALLRSQGRRDEAAAVLTDFVRTNPFGRKPQR